MSAAVQVPRENLLGEVDWNVVAGGFNTAQNQQPLISHYDPTAHQGTSTASSCGTAAAIQATQRLPPIGQLHHYPPSSASTFERASTRQRSSMRRPLSAVPTPGVSQSFATPMRPLTLQEFRDAVRKLSLEDPSIEERIRSLVSHLAPEAYQVVEPVRLHSKSARHFVESLLKLKNRSIRHGFGLTLQEFKVRAQEEIEKNSSTAEHDLECLMQQLGPDSQAALREKYLFRESLQDFVNQIDSICLPQTKRTAFSRSYLAAVIDTLCEMDSSVPQAPYFDLVQSDVTPKIRFILAEWLFDVSTRFKFCPETIFLALALTDRYMMVQRVARTEAQLVGVAALVLAAKYEEVYPPEIKEFVYMSANAFSAADITRMERQLFVRLQFGVTVATLNSIVTCLLAEQDPAPMQLQTLLAQYISTVLVISTHLGQYSQAHLAAAVMYVTRVWFGIATELPSIEVQRLLPLVANTLLSVNANVKMGATVFKHYADPLQMQVSTLPVPPMVLAMATDQRAVTPVCL